MFKQMENISLFLAACRTLGVPSFDCFETNDLFQGKNAALVAAYFSPVTAHDSWPYFSSFSFPWMVFCIPATRYWLRLHNGTEKNMQGVLRCLDSLGRTVQAKCPSFSGPHLGAKMATKNERNFDPALLKASKAAVNKLNMGSAGYMERKSCDISTSVTFGNEHGRGDSGNLHTFLTPKGTQCVAQDQSVAGTGQC